MTSRPSERALAAAGHQRWRRRHLGHVGLGGVGGGVGRAAGRLRAGGGGRPAGGVGRAALGAPLPPPLPPLLQHQFQTLHLAARRLVLIQRRRLRWRAQNMMSELVMSIGNQEFGIPRKYQYQSGIWYFCPKFMGIFLVFYQDLKYGLQPRMLSY